MHVHRITDPAELPSLRQAWDRLADDVPFRGWDWNATWWKHYGEQGRLYVLVVRDDSAKIVGIAPWHLDRSAARGRVLRFLGAGEVCSDYSTVVCRDNWAQQVAAVIADWLVKAKAADAWDLIEFSNVEAADSAMSALNDELRRAGCKIVTRPAMNCWRLELPQGFESYVATLSKGHRKQVRRMIARRFDTGEVVFRTIDNEREFDAAFDALMDLHQKRWKAQGEEGVFSSVCFASFHREIAHTFLKQGRLRLHRLEIAGETAAMEYFLIGGGVTYGYQSGVDPDRLDDEPGNLSHVAVIRNAFAEGFRAIDFLRGDEPYKPHFRARPRPCVDIEIVPPKLAARLRHTAWQTARRVKKWWREKQSSPLVPT